MPLAGQVSALATRLGGEFKVVRAEILAQRNQKDMFQDLPVPWIISHRGGSVLHPEETRAGYDRSAYDGFTLECDCYQLSDGTWVLLHDATGNRTMTLPNAPSTYTSAQWRNGRVKAIFDGGNDEAPMFLSEFLGRYAGVVPLMPELKSGDRTDFIYQFTSRNLHRAVMLQSFTLADAQAFEQAGIRGMFLLAGTISTTPATITAAGVTWVGVSTAMSSADVTTLKNAGLKVVVYTLTTASVAATFSAAGAVGFFCDDAWTVANQIPIRSSGVLESGYLWPDNRKQIYSAGSSQPWPNFNVVNGEIVSTSTASAETLATSGRFVDLPYLGLFSRGTFQISWRSHFYVDAASGQGSNIGIYLYANTVTPEKFFMDGASAGQNGFTVIARRNGVIQPYKYVNGAAAAAITGTTAVGEFAPIGKSGIVDTVVRFTPTAVIMSSSNGVTLSSADTFLVNNMRLGIRITATDGAISNIRVKRS